MGGPEYPHCECGEQEPKSCAARRPPTRLACPLIGRIFDHGFCCRDCRWIHFVGPPCVLIKRYTCGPWANIALSARLVCKSEQRWLPTGVGMTFVFFCPH